MKAILTAAWAATLVVTALPAIAAQPELNTQSVKVNYSDLNLASPHGVSTLQNRVSGAIQRVCGGTAVALNEKLQQQACERAAESSAQKSIATAISTSKQQPTASPALTATPSAFPRTNSSSNTRHGNRQILIPRR